MAIQEARGKKRACRLTAPLSPGQKSPASAQDRVCFGLDFRPPWVYIGITKEGVPCTRRSQQPARRRETRISVRIKPAEKALIARAARLRDATLTEFVLENALQAASQVVAEQKHFEMTPEQFRRFCRALDARPPRT